MSDEHNTAPSTHKPADYRRTHFPHATLTPIVGDLDYPKVQLLQQEILANACSIPSTLGGGRHGHGGIACSVPNYASISDVCYDRPKQPSPVEHGDKATAPQIAETNRIHNAELEKFHEANHIERTLLNQLLETLGKDVLAPVINPTTGLFEVNIPDLFDYLFTTYGNITARSIAKARTEAQDQKYDHSKPLAHMFTLFRTFKDMSAAFGTHESDEHLINMATTILHDAKISHLDFRFWNKLPANDKTWINFQLHFIEAQSELKLSNPDLVVATPATLGYSDPRVNAVESLLYDLNAAVVPPAYTNTDPSDYPSTVPPTLVTPTPPPTHQANVAAPDPSQLRMLDILMKLEAKIDNKTSNATNNGKNGNKGKKPKKTKNVQNYCWTHGACSHVGSDCNNPANGHKKEATFTNMMNGSTKNCFWIPAPSST